MAIEKGSFERTPGELIPRLRVPGWAAAAFAVGIVLLAASAGAVLMAEATGRTMQVQFPGNASISLPSTAGSVTVIGEGRVAAAPDTIYTDLGANATKSTLPEALAAVAADSSKLTAALKGAGVAEADIQTTGLSSWPKTDYYGNVTGYTASANLRVRIRDVSKVTSILNAAAAAIGNDLSLGQLQYSRTDIAAQSAQARQLALTAAQERASAVAKLSGRQAGKITSVEETFVGYVPAGQTVQGLGGGGGGASFPQVQNGQGEVLVHLSVTYSLN